MSSKSMAAKLGELLAKAAGHEMTDAERETQRRSFAYGNVKLHNDSITRELVDKVADSMPQRPVA